MAPAQDTPLVRFAEFAVRRRVFQLIDGEFDPDKVEPMIQARRKLWREMDETELATMLLMELGPHEFHRA